MAWWTALTASAVRTTLVQNISCALLVIILWMFFFENNRPASRRLFINESSSLSRRTACRAMLTWTSTRKGKIDHFYSDKLKLELEFALVSYFHNISEENVRATENSPFFQTFSIDFSHSDNCVEFFALTFWRNINAATSRSIVNVIHITFNEDKIA